MDDGATISSGDHEAGETCSAKWLSSWHSLSRWLEMRDFTEKDCELVPRTYESAKVPRFNSTGVNELVKEKRTE